MIIISVLSAMAVRHCSLNKMEIKMCVTLSTIVLRRIDFPDSMIYVFIHIIPFAFMILVRYLIDNANSSKVILT